MAHPQKPDFVFRRNGRVHLNRRGRQFSRLLAAEIFTSELVMFDTPRSEVVWEYWLPTPFARFPFTSPTVRHRVPSGFKCTLPSEKQRKYLHVQRTSMVHFKLVNRSSMDVPLQTTIYSQTFLPSKLNSAYPNTVCSPYGYFVMLFLSLWFLIWSTTQ